MRIDIKGFVSVEEEYVGKTYMNRPIISAEQFEKEKNSIILVAEEVPRERLHILSENKVVFWSEALGINKKLKNERIIIYGIGHGATKIEEQLFAERMEASLYCVTTKNEEVLHKGKKLISLGELGRYEDCAVIISVLTEKGRM